jgi:hypothetical protein
MFNFLLKRFHHSTYKTIEIVYLYLMQKDVSVHFVHFVHELQLAVYEENEFNAHNLTFTLKLFAAGEKIYTLN